MRILVTGGDGVMGKALRAYLPDAVYCSHAELDVTDSEAVWRRIWEDGPNLVIHAAAITDHQCPDIGALINTNILGTLNVAKAIGQIGKMVYLSTHYVYPGEKGNYKETDECKPIGNYAWTKYAGERVVQSLCPNHLIIRGSWYTFEKLQLWKFGGAVADAWCNRMPVPEAAAKIAKLVECGAWGTYNIGGTRRTFPEILHDEGFPPLAITRDEINKRIPYAFPRDTSVNTDKYDVLVGE